MKLVVEPSGAVGVAALLARPRRRRAVGVVLSGGNVGVARFAELAAAATLRSRRRARRRPCCSAAATSSSPPGQLPEHPAGQQLVDAAVEDDRRERRIEVGAELARLAGRAR